MAALAAAPAAGAVAAGAAAASAAAGEAAGPGALGALSKALALGPAAWLAVPTSGAGVALGGASLAAGIAVAKAWCDASDGVYARRLAEIRRCAPLTAAPGVGLAAAAKQLLLALDWCLLLEEQQGSPADGLLGVGRGLLATAPPAGGGASEPAGRRAAHPDREFRRQLRRIWRLCAQQPPPGAARSGSGGERVSSSLLRRAARGFPGAAGGGSQDEAYERLFNPARGGASGPRSVCAALCFLVSAFLELRRAPPGSLRDAERSSLRLAAAALARHPLFEECDAPAECADGSGAADTGGAGEEAEFRRRAQALLCLLDAALCWRPIDPMGWAGHCEDDSGVVVAHVKGVCSYPVFAAKIRRGLQRAAGGCRVTWRRVGVHLDELRARSLPEPWPWAWLHAEDASMLVRNRTKVRLRVELYRPQSRASPWADWPLLRSLTPEPRPVLVGEVGPGFEWGLRPRAQEGQQFRLRLVTEAGVVVCSRRMRRGQTFDFEVEVPPRPSPRAAIARRLMQGDLCIDESVVGLGPSRGKRGAGEESVCSTAAPSSAGAPSSAPSVAPAGERAPARPWPARREEGADQAQPALALVESLECAVCPRCLRRMAPRCTRPTKSIYSGGVQCDRCGDELVSPAPAEEAEGSQEAAGSTFFHCSKCWYDLCHRCALNEMREVWWGED